MKASSATTHGRTQLWPLLLKYQKNNNKNHSPIDAGDVNDHIDHITAQFIGLHVYRRAVCGDVDLTDHIKQKGLLYPWILSVTNIT